MIPPVSSPSAKASLKLLEQLYMQVSDLHVSSDAGADNLSSGARDDNVDAERAVNTYVFSNSELELIFLSSKF